MNRALCVIGFLSCIMASPTVIVNPTATLSPSLTLFSIFDLPLFRFEFPTREVLTQTTYEYVQSYRQIHRETSKTHVHAHSNTPTPNSRPVLDM